MGGRNAVWVRKNKPPHTRAPGDRKTEKKETVGVGVRVKQTRHTNKACSVNVTGTSGSVRLSLYTEESTQGRIQARKREKVPKGPNRMSSLRQERARMWGMSREVKECTTKVRMETKKRKQISGR